MFGMISTPNTHWESVFEVRRLFCLHAAFKEVPKTPTTGGSKMPQDKLTQTNILHGLQNEASRELFPPVHVCTTGQRLPKETTESQILLVTCSLLLIIKERDWLKLKDEVIFLCSFKKIQIISSHSDIMKCKLILQRNKRTGHSFLKQLQSNFSPRLKKHLQPPLIHQKATASLYKPNSQHQTHCYTTYYAMQHSQPKTLNTWCLNMVSIHSIHKVYSYGPQGISKQSDLSNILK